MIFSLIILLSQSVCVFLVLLSRMSPVEQGTQIKMQLSFLNKIMGNFFLPFVYITDIYDIVLYSF